jgi:hypothetical protein
MKRFILLSVLMTAPGLGRESMAFSNHAAAAGAPGEGLGARPVYEYGTEQEIDRHAERNLSRKKKLLTDPTNEVEVKRLKLMFLLMMSLGQYRAPVH